MWGGHGIAYNGRMRALNPADLQSYIDQAGIDATLIAGIGETPTVPAAAAALGVDPDQIIKTLLFLIETPNQPGTAPRPILVISHGQKRVDKGALAAYMGVSKKRVTLAPANVVLELLGYPAGGVPPFGHQNKFSVLIDGSVLGLRVRFAGVIFGGGGDDRTMMRLSVDELIRTTAPEVVALS